MPEEHAEFEVWVRIDRFGWELYELVDGSFEKFLELDSCDTSISRETYASYVLDS